MTAPIDNPIPPAAPVKMKVPLWLLGWLLLLTIVGGYFIYTLWQYKKETYVWNTQMRRWAAHYYYCDSKHSDEAKCAQWSDHIPPPPPPPQ